MWYSTCQPLSYLKVPVNKQHYDKSLQFPWGVLAAAGSLRSLCSQSCKYSPWLSTQRAQLWMVWCWNALTKISQYSASGISIFSWFEKPLHFFLGSGKKFMSVKLSMCRRNCPWAYAVSEQTDLAVRVLLICRDPLTIRTKVLASSKAQATGKLITSLD